MIVSPSLALQLKWRQRNADGNETHGTILLSTNHTGDARGMAEQAYSFMNLEASCRCGPSQGCFWARNYYTSSCFRQGAKRRCAESYPGSYSESKIRFKMFWDKWYTVKTTCGGSADADYRTLTYDFFDDGDWSHYERLERRSVAPFAIFINWRIES